MCTSMGECGVVGSAAGPGVILSGAKGACVDAWLLPSRFARSQGDDLEVGAALGTGDDLALVDLVFLDVEIALTLGT